MGFNERASLIRAIEAERGSKVICYLTSTRPGAGAQMAEDAVRVFFDHLLLLPKRPIERLDIFLCSNGGNGVVSWRLISLLREYAKSIGVLLPYRAYSAATMLALGADEIVMHPFAEMGPIDPTVSNDFNPTDPLTHRRLGISVEDVKAYISFVKETVGIRQETELIKAIEILAEKIHPLALGNVDRFIAQSRMIARKILLTHMSQETSGREIDETIETLASKLYFHGHPINRKEAREELGLKVAAEVAPALEAAMWKLYLGFEEELQNTTVFDPFGEIYGQVPDAQLGAMVQEGRPPLVPSGTMLTKVNQLAFVESAALSSVFSMTRRYVVVGNGSQGEPLLRTEVLAEGWEHTPTTPAVT